MQSISLRVEDIEIGERHRALSTDAVQRLAGSMNEIGLKQPISVRIVDEMEVGGELVSGVPLLVAGAHRLAAAKSLGWEKIDCIEVEDDPISAELWEIAENLHRCDLSKEQRDEHFRRYVELLTIKREIQSAQNGPIESKREDRRGHRPQGVLREAAQDVGLSYSTAKRIMNPPPRLVDPPEPARDPLEAYYKWLSEMNRVWGRAPQEWRERWLEEIDTPVFDQTSVGGV